MSRFHDYLRDKALVRPEHLEKLCSGCLSNRTVKKGKILLMKDELCKHTFFVESGLLRMYSIDGKGKEHIIQFAPEDWFVSDRSSIYFGQKSEYFIDAIEDSVLSVLDPQYFEDANNISPEFRTYNDYLLQNHIRHLQDRVNMLIGANAQDRYIEFLRLYPDLTQRVPQWMIASYLGITAESLSRVRKEMATHRTLI
ncbi:MAG: Crp/Fnr family transcriptional regulator [Bacteroidia bacterium]|nr:Crp/Fnr family transcriptional regulator [Bacteroidia bacterium]